MLYICNWRNQEISGNYLRNLLFCLKPIIQCNTADNTICILDEHSMYMHVYI